jgi:xanthine dehydrogenase small subunit
VTLTDAFAALVADRPQLQDLCHRFAGLPVRNSGTLGGNVANGSPIGDSMPLLIALGANVVLMSHARPPRAAAGRPLHRLPPERDGARRGAGLDQGAPPAKAEMLRVYKISKRFDDDISAVCLA